MGKSVKNIKKIAIQGGYGAFHEIASLHYFENEEIEIVPRKTFKDLFHSLNNSHVDYGITAIENSLAGSILPNYGLILESSMEIVGEIYLRIQLNLVALPGQKITDLKEVYSHPMAILQCQKFFEDYPEIRLIDSHDTALSAKKISEEKLKGVGAIASHLAAEKYGLEIMAAGIETNKKNYTRFLILGEKNGKENHGEVNKASLHFTVSHQFGSLAKVLITFSFYNINLSKIQSMPIVGKGWEYQFYADVEFNDHGIYKQALAAIRPFTGELNVLGEYQKGKSVLE